MPLNLADAVDAVDVQNLTPYFKLCCKDRALCTLCMVLDIEVDIDLDKDLEDYSEETRNPKGTI